jgi:hypothetical protein
MDNNPHFTLYTKLKEQGLYTKSYDQFRTQFAGKEKTLALFSAMKDDGHYTKTEDDFVNQFFKPTFVQQAKEKQPDYRTIDIRDERNIDPVTKAKIADTSRLHIKADIEPLKHIIKVAKENGVDPYTALALAHQETLFKPEYGDNPFNLLSGGRLKPETADSDMVDLSMKELGDKFAMAKRLGKKSEAEMLQAWNGYGKIGKSSFAGQKDTNRVYGVDVSTNPIDMNKTPLYGQRVIDIRDNILKKNPDIVKLVEEINNTQETPKGQGSLRLP